MSDVSLRLRQDGRLARLAASGDREAFASIYRRHHQAVYRYCRSILGSDEDAADALQNVMVKAMQALDGEARDVALKPWLFRIAHNESISLLRRRRPQAELLTSEGEEFLAGPSPVGTAEDRERLRQLVVDLASLPERQRGALLMRELSGLSYEEVGTALGGSAAAAKQTVFEARSALQELAEGRAMACDAVRRTISERDGRLLRGRRVRAHLRDCGGCRDFRDAIGDRAGSLQALAPPLPAVMAAGLLERIFGGGDDGPGGGLGVEQLGADTLGQATAAAPGAAAGAAGSGGWLAGVLGGPAAVKGAVAVVAAAAVGAGATGIVASSPRETAREARAVPAESVARGNASLPPATGEAREGQELRDDAGEGPQRSRRGARDDDPRGSDATPRAGAAPERRSGAAPGIAPRRPGGERPGARPPMADRSPAQQPPAGGGGLPEPAEQHAGGRVPEPGGSPGSQAPSPAPVPEQPVGSLPDRGATTAPDLGLPALPRSGPADGRAGSP